MISNSPIPAAMRYAPPVPSHYDGGAEGYGLYMLLCGRVSVSARTFTYYSPTHPSTNTPGQSDAPDTSPPAAAATRHRRALDRLAVLCCAALRCCPAAAAAPWRWMDSASAQQEPSVDPPHTPPPRGNDARGNPILSLILKPRPEAPGAL